eukprot:scaffold2808_cov255-Pinguiococcus_pyrenoidosus.AAC.25
MGPAGDAAKLSCQPAELSTELVAELQDKLEEKGKQARCAVLKALAEKSFITSPDGNFQPPTEGESRGDRARFQWAEGAPGRARCCILLRRGLRTR